MSCIALSRADVLVIVSSSGGIYGSSGKLNHAVERMGAKFIGHGLRSKYRKVFFWAESGSPTFSQVWAQALASRKDASEPIDFFAMEHGPASPMDYPGFDAANRVPHGAIRNYYTTGCSNWGGFEANVDGSEIKIRENHGLTKQILDLGVKQFTIHANDNATGAFSLPLLVEAFRQDADWAQASIRAFDKVDGFLARSLGDLRALYSLDVLPADLVNMLGGGVAGGGTDLAGYIATSRPVIGGAGAQAASTVPADRTMLDDATARMLKPTRELTQALEAACPGAFKSATCEKIEPANAPKLSATVFRLAKLVQELIQSYAGQAEGCVEPDVLQELLNVFVRDGRGVVPKLTKTCLNAPRKNTVRLLWSLEPTPFAAAMLRAGLPDAGHEGRDSWKLKLDPEAQDLLAINGEAIEKITLGRHGAFELERKKDGIELRIDGVSAEVPGLPGIIKDIGISRIQLKDDGTFHVRVSLPILNLPVGIRGDARGQEIKEMKFLFFKLPVQAY